MVETGGIDMEFKDKLKILRKERGISQQRLAEEIFVSRSAVAKWENGLGLPSKESLDLLCSYFGVTREYFATDEPELLVVEKNITIHRLITVFITFVAVLFLGVIVALYIGIMSENYGFTSEMAAGQDWMDEHCIHTDDYDIYYYSWYEGEEYEEIANFKPVRKKWYGYICSEEDYEYRDVYYGDKQVAIIYTLEGKDCYYNIIRKVAYIGEDYTYPEWLMVYDSVYVDGKEYPVTINSYFVTEEEFEEFSIGDVVLRIGE